MNLAAKNLIISTLMTSFRSFAKWQLLLDRFGHLAYIQGVLSQLPGNTQHIRRGPCEYVRVIPKETGEREFLFLPELVTDHHCLLWAGEAKADLLC
jgi:hypothetical protein